MPKYISTHIMLFHSIKQYVIILSTIASSNLIPWPPTFRLKVAEHSFGSLLVYAINCQIMARERLQLTDWNLVNEKYTDERFWLTGKMWRFQSFHGNMNDWIQP